MRRLILMALGAAALSGCSSQHAPLIFGQAHSVGIAVGTNPANQTPEISVGYKDVDIAIVPTVYDGNGQPIRGTTVQDGDAYSTFGHFSADARTTEVGLGKFFATGIAARRLADGFACKVSSGTDQTCTRRPPIPPQLMTRRAIRRRSGGLSYAHERNVGDGRYSRHGRNRWHSRDCRHGWDFND